MLNWISSACIVLAGKAGPLYANTTISMANNRTLFHSSGAFFVALPLAINVY